MIHIGIEEYLNKCLHLYYVYEQYDTVQHHTVNLYNLQYHTVEYHTYRLILDSIIVFVLQSMILLCLIIYTVSNCHTYYVIYKATT